MMTLALLWSAGFDHHLSGRYSQVCGGWRTFKLLDGLLGWRVQMARRDATKETATSTARATRELSRVAPHP